MIKKWRNKITRLKRNNIVQNKIKFLPVEYSCEQSAVWFLTISNWGSSMFSSTTNGTSFSHSNIRSSVVWDTWNLFLLVIICKMKFVFYNIKTNNVMVVSISYMKASESKWVNPNDIWYGTNSLRLEGLHTSFVFDSSLKIFIRNVIKLYLCFNLEFFSYTNEKIIPLWCIKGHWNFNVILV